MATLQILRQENSGVVYSDPAKPDLTVRFRNTSVNKALNGVVVRNYLSEIIINDQNEVTVATGVTAKDAVSVRLRVSGCALSKARLTVLLHSLAEQIDAWDSQNVFVGFNPTAAPVIPAAT